MPARSASSVAKATHQWNDSNQNPRFGALGQVPESGIATMYAIRISQLAYFLLIPMVEACACEVRTASPGPSLTSTKSPNPAPDRVPREARRLPASQIDWPSTPQQPHREGHRSVLVQRDHLFGPEGRHLRIQEGTAFAAGHSRFVCHAKGAGQRSSETKPRGVLRSPRRRSDPFRRPPVSSP